MRRARASAICRSATASAAPGATVRPRSSGRARRQAPKSFALSLFDPDAPTGAGFWHWMIFDIPASAMSLPPDAGDPHAGLAPEGSVESKNDAGAIGYFGPCPPEGDKPHRYRFELDALDVAKLGLDAGAAAATVAERVRRHTLAKATLIGIWGH